MPPLKAACGSHRDLASSQPWQQPESPLLCSRGGQGPWCASTRDRLCTEDVAWILCRGPGNWKHTSGANPTFQSQSHGDNQARASALPEPPVGFRGDRFKESPKMLTIRALISYSFLGGPLTPPYTPNIAVDLYSFVRLCENISTPRTWAAAGQGCCLLGLCGVLSANSVPCT